MALRITNQGAFDKAESALWLDGHIGGHEIDMPGTEICQRSVKTSQKNPGDLSEEVSQCLESQISYVPGS
jgi:hypothetical protein